MHIDICTKKACETNVQISLTKRYVAPNFTGIQPFG